MATNIDKDNSEKQHDLSELKEFILFNLEFKDESDRAAVVLGVSNLDNLLYQLLEGFLQPNTGKKDELLEGDSPLSTFSARIHMCYRLGLIDSEFTRALHLVRKIRNSFAHQVSGVSLQSGPQSDRIKDLVQPFWENTMFRKIHKEFYENKEGTAVKFRATVGFMTIRLQGAIKKVKRVNSCLLYTSPSPRDLSTSRMPSSA